MIGIRGFLLLGLCLVSVMTACTMRYSFTGASISSEVRSYDVETFQNNAPLFHPMLANRMTIGLQDKIQSLSSLKLVNADGDVGFRGEITDYSIRPVAVQGDNQAAMNRLTIAIRVRYADRTDPEKSFDQSFSRYEDFPTTQNLNTVEDELQESIVEQLAEDIFNKAFVNW